MRWKRKIIVFLARERAQYSTEQHTPRAEKNPSPENIHILLLFYPFFAITIIMIVIYRGKRIIIVVVVIIVSSVVGARGGTSTATDC